MLSNYRVLDIADEKGALCGKIFADLGADVIKIEKPGGGGSRRKGPFYKDKPEIEKSLNWFFYNQNKRGITLNIESADGKIAFKKLAKTAHFIVETYPPGYLDDLGLGYKELKKVNPGIIMASITPFGQTGPYKDCKGSDLIAAASGGLMFICGDVDRPPVRITAEQCCCHAGAMAAIASLIANYQRKTTGMGQHVDISMQECMVWCLSYAIPRWSTVQQLFPRSGSWQQREGVRMRLLYPCKDGYVYFRIGVAAIMGSTQERLVAAMNEEGLGFELRGINWSAIGIEEITQEDHDRWEKPILEFFSRYTMEELHELARVREIMLAPVKTPEDIYFDRQLAARNYWVTVEHDELGDNIQFPGAFYKSNETKWSTGRRAPLIGEHNKEIYINELGYTEEQLTVLEGAGVI